jgi:hypothetical protein
MTTLTLDLDDIGRAIGHYVSCVLGYHASEWRIRNCVLQHEAKAEGVTCVVVELEKKS